MNNKVIYIVNAVNKKSACMPQLQVCVCVS